MRRDSPLRRALALAGLTLLGLGAALFMSCTAAEEGTLTPTPTRTPRPTQTPVPTPTPTPAWPVTVFIPYGLPAPVAQALEGALEAHPDRLTTSLSADEADVRVVFSPGEDGVPLAEWTYALVAPFPTITDDVAWADLAASWAGRPGGPFAGVPLLMTAETAATLAVVWGQPAPGAVEIVAAEELLARAWQARRAWAIIPFEGLEPRWKVLRIDGQSVLDRKLDTATYPLTVHVDVTGLERGVAALTEAAGPFQTNRDPQEMAVVLLTGVTALARATALRMERYGPAYPAQDIRDWLLEPDITHISNEVSFAQDCPPPSDYSTMVFCSSPAYIGLLADTDVDVVELTGNHVLDWGVDAMRFTLGLYNQYGIPYFGGGDDLARALQPLTLTVGAQTFGFLGCNLVGPEFDWATDSSPGSAPCDFERLTGQIRALRESGIIPIVTLQYWEFYQYEPTPQQQRDFRALADAGAAIVSGSQAHQPQGFDFRNGTFIHYGLGNLFFDQMWSLETRQEFLDRHVFYQGRHISTELLTAMLEDYSRPRPMTPEERAQLLQATFSASGW
jgi:hypothetical protein